MVLSGVGLLFWCLEVNSVLTMFEIGNVGVCILGSQHLELF
jgi:hypothetical protein